MLKFKDIRLGDIVRVNSPNNAAHGQIGRITEVDNDIVHLDLKGSPLRFVEYQFLEGVPVAALDLNIRPGLKDERFMPYYQYFVNDVSIDSDRPLQYVHEFQHAYFDQTGEPLEVPV